MKARIKRLLGRIACATDPDWHPAFRPGVGPIEYRTPVIRGQLLIPGVTRSLFTSHRRYYDWRCTRCGAPMPDNWARESR